MHPGVVQGVEVCNVAVDGADAAAVHLTVDLGHVPVDVGVRVGVAGGPLDAVDGVAYLEVLTREDDIVGDLDAFIRRPANWYRRLLTGAVAYYQDFVKASKKFRLPAGKEREALQDLADTLSKLPEDSTAEFIQNEVYEAGKRHFAQAELRQWFKTLYEVLLGSEQGPRMGAFIKLYGRDNVVRLIDRALAGEDLSQAA